MRRDLLAIVHAGIDAVTPERLLEGSGFRVQGSEFKVREAGRVRIIAVGKAAPRMAGALLRHLDGARVEGLVIAAHPTEIDSRLETIIGGHPVPNAASVIAGRRALAIAGACGPADTLFVLISGGASALMAVPAEGITLEDKGETTARLLKAGADIYALNAVRKHLSAIKGGQLAARCAGRTIAFAISDVVGDDLSVIGSGPTVADPSTFAHALSVLHRFGGTDAYPAAAVRRLERGAAGELSETPKRGDPRLARTSTTVIGGRSDAMSGATREAASRGYHTFRVESPIVGEARVQGRAFVQSGVRLALERPACVVASGETTVTVTGNGTGGRNQEFALAAAVALAEAGHMGGVASVGTDGIDGPTDAAGALADDTTLARAAAAGLARPDVVLASNDSYPFFAALGDLVRTGPTGTNVGDLQIFLLA